MEGRNIYQKISDIMSEVSYLSKDDTVGKGENRYRAITEEKVTTTIRAAMIKHGIVIIPIERDSKRTDSEPMQDKYGNWKIQRLTETKTKYRVLNIEDKEDYVDVISLGSGVDTQDKGVGKAMTYDYKYLLLRLFAIPTGEDPDKIASDLIDNELKKKQELTPSHKKWPGAVKALKDGTTNLEVIKNYYEISEQNIEKLIDEAQS